MTVSPTLHGARAGAAAGLTLRFPNDSDNPSTTPLPRPVTAQGATPAARRRSTGVTR